MKKSKWYGYTFEDGTYTIVRGMNLKEQKAQEKKHGKLLRKEYLYTI